MRERFLEPRVGVRLSSVAVTVTDDGRLTFVQSNLLFVSITICLLCARRIPRRSACPKTVDGHLSLSVHHLAFQTQAAASLRIEFSPRPFFAS